MKTGKPHRESTAGEHKGCMTDIRETHTDRVCPSHTRNTYLDTIKTDQQKKRHMRGKKIQESNRKGAPLNQDLRLNSTAD